MDLLFLMEASPQNTIFTVDEEFALDAQSEAVLTMPTDEAVWLMSRDSDAYLLVPTNELPGGSELAQASVNLQIENDNAEIVPGYVGTLELYQVVRILEVSITADQVGSIELALRYCSFDDFPGGLTSIIGVTPPHLTAEQKRTDTTLTGWTRDVGPGVIEVTVVSAADVVKATLSMHLGL